MVVHMIPGIHVNDSRVKWVKLRAKYYGLKAEAHTEKGGTENIVLVYLKDDVRKSGEVPEFVFETMEGVDKAVRVSRSSLSIVSDENGVGHEFRIGSATVGISNPILPVIGPCTVSSSTPAIIEFLAKQGVKHVRGGAVKPRTRSGNFYGLGERGYEILLRAARDNGIESVWTEVMDTSNIDQVCRQRDAVKYEGQIVLWVGARTGNQVLLRELGRRKEFVVMLKHGLDCASSADLIDAAGWVVQGPMDFTDAGEIAPGNIGSGNQKIILCVRGLNAKKMDEHCPYRFYPNYDWIEALKDRTWAPVCFDPSHIAGQSRYVRHILSEGLDHEPDIVLIEAGLSPVDKEQALPLEEVHQVLTMINNHSAGRDKFSAALTAMGRYFRKRKQK